jgi:hypothetical protein
MPLEVVVKQDIVLVAVSAQDETSFLGQWGSKSPTVKNPKHTEMCVSGVVFCGRDA